MPTGNLNEADEEDEEIGAAEFEFIGREDFTGQRTVNQRRLDSYAKLLAARSMCVSVSILNAQVYISANEFFKGTLSADKNKNVYSIEKIAAYFSKIVSYEKTDEEKRKEAFLEICSVARFSTQYKSPFSKKIAEKVANDVYQRTDPKISEIFTQYGKSAPMASIMYAKFQSLLNDFSKLEEELKADHSELKEIFSKSHVILKADYKVGMHAEMQQLAKLISYIEESILAHKKIAKQEIYFGISKLCCLHCHATLKAANEIFKENSIPINLIVRGWHDLDKRGLLSDDVFKEKISGSTMSEKKEGDNIGFLIKNRSEKILTFMIEKERHSKQEVRRQQPIENDSEKEESDDYIDMDQSESGSESPEAIKRKIEILQSLLQQQKKMLIAQNEAGVNLARIIRKLDIAIELLSIRQFTDIPKEDLDLIMLSSSVDTILALLNVNKKEKEKITKLELCNIIKDPLLVGEIFSNPFKEFSLLDILYSTTLDTVVEKKHGMSRAVKPQHIRFDGDGNVVKPSRKHIRFDDEGNAVEPHRKHIRFDDDGNVIEPPKSRSKNPKNG